MLAVTVAVGVVATVKLIPARAQPGPELRKYLQLQQLARSSALQLVEDEFPLGVSHKPAPANLNPPADCF